MYPLDLLLLLSLAVALPFSQPGERLEREIEIAPELNTGSSLQQSVDRLKHYHIISHKH